MPKKSHSKQEVNLIDFDQVQELTSINNRTTLARYESQGLFPARVKLSPGGKIVWVRQEVEHWVSELLSSRKN